MHAPGSKCRVGAYIDYFQTIVSRYQARDAHTVKS
jgi:hypothetical protein